MPRLFCKCHRPALLLNLGDFTAIAWIEGGNAGYPDCSFDHPLRGKIEQALLAAPADCAALAAAIKPIGEACKSCHQKYR